MNNLPWYFYPIALAILGSAWWFRRKAERAFEPRDKAPPKDQEGTDGGSPLEKKGDLVAIIAAAVSAASGLDPSQFRIAGFSAVASTGVGSHSGTPGASSWNGPLWGRIERFARSDNNR